MDDDLTCPFCGFKSRGVEYEMLLHLETFHAEGKSPFIAENSEGGCGGHEGSYAECPVDGCSEIIALVDMDYHMELHAGEGNQQLNEDGVELLITDGQRDNDEGPSGILHSVKANGPARQSSQKHKQRSTIQAWKKLLSIPTHGKRHLAANSRDLQTQKRLGKAELGKYAHEQHMPEWLVSLLRKGGEVKTEGIIPVLGQLLQQSRSTEYAYLCHPCVQHVSKLRREGGFCGYRNIQMMVSYIIGAGSNGSMHFNNEIPTVFQIQDLIETAWDLGINAQGRIETGGIRGTRKYIGTPEAQALLCSLGIPCTAEGFKDKEAGKSEARLMRAIERYFQQGVSGKAAISKIAYTTLPPIYFQHPGHSLTIIGLEKQTHGPINLLVFDPMFRDAVGISRLIGHAVHHKHPEDALKPYRRGSKYLHRYKEFETLRLVDFMGVLEQEQLVS